MEPVDPDCASAIDALVLQNATMVQKEIVKEHLVVLLLYVVTEGHKYISVVGRQLDS